MCCDRNLQTNLLVCVTWLAQGGEDVFVCQRVRNGNVAIRRYYNGVRGSAPSDRDDRHLVDKEWEPTETI